MKPPEEIHNVSNSQLSIARHYGGINYNGQHYHYDASQDVLIRQDIWLARMKAARADGKSAMLMPFLQPIKRRKTPRRLGGRKWPITLIHQAPE